MFSASHRYNRVVRLYSITPYHVVCRHTLLLCVTQSVISAALSLARRGRWPRHLTRMSRWAGRGSRQLTRMKKVITGKMGRVNKFKSIKPRNIEEIYKLSHYVSLKIDTMSV